MAIKYAKLKEMGIEELAKEERELRAAIWKMQLQRSTGQVQDPNKLGAIRRDLARVLTAMRARELAQAGGR